MMSHIHANTWISAIACAVLGLMGSTRLAESREWKYTNPETGKISTCEAEFQTVEGDRAVLVAQDRRTLRPLISGLSQEDRRYIDRAIAAYHAASSGEVGDDAKVLMEGEHVVTSVAWSPDGRVAAWIEENDTLSLFDLAAQRVEIVSSDQSDLDRDMRKVCFTADSQSLVSGHGCKIMVWDVRTRALQRQFQAGDGRRYDAFWMCADGTRCLVKSVTGADRPVYLELLDLTSDKKLKEIAFDADKSRWKTVAMDPSGKQFALMIGDGQVRRFNAITADELPGIRLRGEVRKSAALKYSPDGKTLAVAFEGEDFVTLWACGVPDAAPELKGRLAVAGFRGALDRRCEALAFSPDNRFVALYGASMQEKPVWLHDVTTLAPRFGVAGEGIGAFSPDGRMLVSGTYANPEHLVISDATTGAQLRTLPGKSDRVAFSPDGRHLLTAGKKAPVRLWEMSKNPSGKQEVVTVAEIGNAGVPNSHIADLRFSPGGTHLLATGDFPKHGHAKIYDVGIAAELCTVANPNETTPRRQLDLGVIECRTMCVLPAQNQVVLWGMQDHDRKEAVQCRWSMQTGKLITYNRFSAPQGGSVRNFDVKCAEVSSNGKLLAVAVHDRGVYSNAVIVFGLPAGEVLHYFGETSKETWRHAVALRFSADAKVLGAAYQSPAEVKVWTLETGQPRVLPVDHDGPMEILANGQRLWCFQKNGRAGRDLEQINVSTGQIECQISEADLRQPHSSMALAIALSPTGTAFATADEDGTVLVRDPASGKTIHTLTRHRSKITSMAFSPGGRVLATGDQAGKICLWRLPMGSADTVGAPSPLQNSSPLAPASIPQASVQVPQPMSDLSRNRPIVGLETWCTFSVQGRVRETDGELTFSDDGSVLALASGVSDGAIHAWLVTEKKTSHVASGVSCKTSYEYRPCRNPRWLSPDGKFVIAQGYFEPENGGSRVWRAVVINMQSGEVKKLNFPAPDDHIDLSNATFTGSGAIAVLDSSNRRLWLIDIANGQLVKEQQCFEIAEMLRAPMGKYLMVLERPAGNNGTVSLFDGATLERKAEVSLDRPHLLAFSPDGTGLLVDRSVSNYSTKTMLEFPKLSVRWDFRENEFVDLFATRMLTEEGVLLNLKSGTGQGNVRRSAVLDLAKARYGVKHISKPLALMNDATTLWTTDKNRVMLHDVSGNRLTEPLSTEVAEIALWAVSPDREYVAIAGETRQGWVVQVLHVVRK